MNGEKMPPSSCMRATNNRFFDCPPLMADGRAFTDYRPKGVQAIEDIVPLHKGSYDILQHFESRGVELIDEQRAKTFDKNVCAPCVDTVLRERDEQRCSANACSAEVSQHDDPVHGLGQGRDYSISEPYSFAAPSDSKEYARFDSDADTYNLTLNLHQQPPCAHMVDPFNPFDLDLSDRLAHPRG